MGKFTVTHEINCNAETFWKTVLRQGLQQQALPRSPSGSRTSRSSSRQETETTSPARSRASPRWTCPAPCEAPRARLPYTEEGSFEKADRHLALEDDAQHPRRQAATRAASSASSPSATTRSAASPRSPSRPRSSASAGSSRSSAEKQLRDGWDKSAVFMNKYLGSPPSSARHRRRPGRSAGLLRAPLPRASVSARSRGAGPSQRGCHERDPATSSSSAAASAASTRRARARATCRSPWSTARTTTPSSRCSTRWRPPALNPSDIATPDPAHPPRPEERRSVLLGERHRRSTSTRDASCFADGELAYDYLILATGATHSYFGHAEWAADRARASRPSRTRWRSDAACSSPSRPPSARSDPERPARLAHVRHRRRRPDRRRAGRGAGEIARQTPGARLPAHRSRRSARVILLEGSPRVLPAYPPELSREGRRAARAPRRARCGTSAQVTDIDERGVCVGDDAHPRAHRALGRRRAASPLARVAGRAARPRRARAGRAGPDRPRAPEVFVIGDLAAVRQDGGPSPAWRPPRCRRASTRRGTSSARSPGKPPEPFHYTDQGTLATIGRAAARRRLRPAQALAASSPGWPGSSSTSSS